jgi:hypothetical protein
VKTSLSPGSGVVTRYLEASGLLPELEKLGQIAILKMNLKNNASFPAILWWATVA